MYCGHQAQFIHSPRSQTSLHLINHTIQPFHAQVKLSILVNGRLTKLALGMLAYPLKCAPTVTAAASFKRIDNKQR